MIAVELKRQIAESAAAHYDQGKVGERQRQQRNIQVEGLLVARKQEACQGDTGRVAERLKPLDSITDVLVTLLLFIAAAVGSLIA